MILDIVSLASSFIDRIREEVNKKKISPRLDIILVGDNPASQVYVRNKLKKCEAVGIVGMLHELPDDISQEDLLQRVVDLNNDPDVHGILIQSPLPKHISATIVFNSIYPQKDVDGFGKDNIARLYSGDLNGLIPGTPKGVMKIIEDYFYQKQRAKSKEQNDGILVGKHAVVIGKSTIVGKPLSLLLLEAGVTVTLCHSRTRDISTHTQQADIVISAVGKKHLITADMIRPGALVIDVGINVEEIEGKKKLFGDCDTENIGKIADVTPVPGGVGPMTIAMLLENVVRAYDMQENGES